MASKSHIQWLLQELPQLVAKGILTQTVAENVRDYYRSAETRNLKQFILAIFGSLGAILVGLGIIFLIAYNWHYLSRFIRCSMALGLLLSAQGLVYWVWLKKSTSSAWREGSATFLMAMIGASIALISQTYHIPGDLDSFLLVWMVLSLPLFYLMNATLPAILYLVGISFWVGYTQDAYHHHYPFEWLKSPHLFWLLYLCAVPFFTLKIKPNRFSNAAVFLAWGLVLSLLSALFIIILDDFEHIWLMVLTNYATLLYLLGVLWFREAPGMLQRPFHTLGTAGLILFAFLSTYDWAWDHFHGFFPWLTLGLAALGIAWAIQKKNWVALLYFIFPLLQGLTCFRVGIWTLHLFNVYLLALGSITIWEGYKKSRIGMCNGGMLILAVLIFIRFVVPDYGLLTRGIIFLGLGGGFFAANYFLAKKLKGGEK